LRTVRAGITGTARAIIGGAADTAIGRTAGSIITGSAGTAVAFAFTDVVGECGRNIHQQKKEKYKKCDFFHDFFLLLTL
jgi:hypothetical protein